MNFDSVTSHLKYNVIR